MDIAAAAVLAAAAGYCGLRLAGSATGAAIAFVLALACGLAVLRAVRPEERRFPIPAFPAVELAEPEPELVLGEDGRLADADLPAELLLDDVLADLAPDSRVVRLFDPAAMPTPGELRARIDRHLGAGRPAAAVAYSPLPDASQALHEALAELRRSLR